MSKLGLKYNKLSRLWLRHKGSWKRGKWLSRHKKKFMFNDVNIRLNIYSWFGEGLWFTKQS